MKTYAIATIPGKAKGLPALVPGGAGTGRARKTAGLTGTKAEA